MALVVEGLVAVFLALCAQSLASKQGVNLRGTPSLNLKLDHEITWVDTLPPEWLLPGTAHLLHGVDIVSGEERTRAIFQFTYGGVADPYDANNPAKGPVKTLQLPGSGQVCWYPDQMAARPNFDCEFASISESYSNSVAYSESMSLKMGVSASIAAAGSFSTDASVTKARETTSDGSWDMFVDTARCLTSSVEYVDHGSLTADFKRALAALPKILPPFPQHPHYRRYTKFLATYGTHFYKSADLGGELKQMKFMKRSSVTSAESASTSASLSLQANIGGGAITAAADVSAGSNQQSSSGSGSGEANTHIFAKGGKPGAFSSSSDGPLTWGAWASSIPKQPVAVNPVFAPLWQLPAIAADAALAGRIRDATARYVGANAAGAMGEYQVLAMFSNGCQDFGDCKLQQQSSANGLGKGMGKGKGKGKGSKGLGGKNAAEVAAAGKAARDGSTTGLPRFQHRHHSDSDSHSHSDSVGGTGFGTELGSSGSGEWRHSEWRHRHLETGWEYNSRKARMYPRVAAEGSAAAAWYPPLSSPAADVSLLQQQQLQQRGNSSSSSGKSKGKGKGSTGSQGSTEAGAAGAEWPPANMNNPADYPLLTVTGSAGQIVDWALGENQETPFVYGKVCVFTTTSPSLGAVSQLKLWMRFGSFRYLRLTALATGATYIFDARSSTGTRASQGGLNWDLRPLRIAEHATEEATTGKEGEGEEEGSGMVTPQFFPALSALYAADRDRYEIVVETTASAHVGKYGAVTALLTGSDGAVEVVLPTHQERYWSVVTRRHALMTSAFATAAAANSSSSSSDGSSDGSSGSGGLAKAVSPPGLTVDHNAAFKSFGVRRVARFSFASLECGSVGLPASVTFLLAAPKSASRRTLHSAPAATQRKVARTICRALLAVEAQTDQCEALQNPHPDSKRAFSSLAQLSKQYDMDGITVEACNQVKELLQRGDSVSSCHYDAAKKVWAKYDGSSPLPNTDPIPSPCGAKMGCASGDYCNNPNHDDCSIMEPLRFGRYFRPPVEAPDRRMLDIRSVFVTSYRLAKTVVGQLNSQVTSDGPATVQLW